jgi:dihydroorotase
MNDYLIVGASLLGVKSDNLAISQGVFVSPENMSPRHAITIDAAGLVALPGLVDLHTHLREPGMEQAETVLTGSQAAALGGFSAVHAMANTTPVADTSAVTDHVWDLGRSAGYVDVRPVGAISRGLAGKELAPLEEMAGSVAQVRVFSDDGHCVDDSRLMQEALERVSALGGVVAQHAQDPRLTEGSQMNSGEVAIGMGLKGWPDVAEETIIARDVLLAQSVGARLHVCHLSTAGSVAVVAWAKARGIAVTAEVTPHHLLLTEDLLREGNPTYKVNPPLRTKEDTLALREAVASGVIDIVATDHAPHPEAAKKCAFSLAAFGMLGLETALPVVLETLVKPGYISLVDVARVMSSGPARIGKVSGYAKPFALGEPAHFTLIDTTSVTPPPRASLSSNNPYLGVALSGQVLHTFFAGSPTVRDGALVPAPEVHHRRKALS